MLIGQRRIDQGFAFKMSILKELTVEDEAYELVVYHFLLKKGLKKAAENVKAKSVHVRFYL